MAISGTALQYLSETRRSAGWAFSKWLLLALIVGIWSSALIGLIKRMDSLVVSADTGEWPLKGYGQLNRRWHLFGITNYALLVTAILLSIFGS